MSSAPVPGMEKRPTFDGGAAHQVGVGEVEGGVQAEVGLHDAPHLLGHVVVQVGTLQRNFPFLSQLPRRPVVSRPERPGCGPTEPTEASPPTPLPLLPCTIALPCSTCPSSMLLFVGRKHSGHQSCLACLTLITLASPARMQKSTSLNLIHPPPWLLKCG